jgi:hypothetical protein
VFGKIESATYSKQARLHISFAPNDPETEAVFHFLPSSIADESSYRLSAIADNFGPATGLTFRVQGSHALENST